MITSWKFLQQSLIHQIVKLWWYYAKLMEFNIPLSQKLVPKQLLTNKPM